MSHSFSHSFSHSVSHLIIHLLSHFLTQSFAVIYLISDSLIEHSLVKSEEK